MRLTANEKNHIIALAKSIFKDFELYLFGSRVDNNKKGGDIDLYIKLNTSIDEIELLNKETFYLTELQKNIGEQKIDLVINNRNDDKLIYNSAEQTGVRLC